jgi:hypothetical protein
MEAFVLSVYGLWFWLTRNYRAARYREAADSLRTARLYLLNDFATRASTRDRGYMLPHQVEALDLLERHSAFIAQTSRRFRSLSECCRFIAEELTQPQAAIEMAPPASQLPLPAQPFFAPLASRMAARVAAVAAGFSSLSSLSSFWSSESSGSIGDLRLARWKMPTVFSASANPLSPLAPNSKPQVQ